MARPDTFQIITPADPNFPIDKFTLEPESDSSELSWTPLSCCDYAVLMVEIEPPLEVSREG